jgi:hypothetical protein
VQVLTEKDWMTRRLRVLVLEVVLFSGVLLGQQSAPAPNPKLTTDPKTVVVTGTFQPIPLEESNRSVVSLSTQQSPLLYNSFVDYLDQDASIDLQQRGADGVQADLSIRGSTFEQALVLLNGLRINDAQSSHHNMDIPIPLDATSRIEVLHGTGSTFYGSDAIAGAVNFISTRPEGSELRLGAETSGSTNSVYSESMSENAGRKKSPPAVTSPPASFRIATTVAAQSHPKHASGPALATATFCLLAAIAPSAPSASTAIILRGSAPKAGSPQAVSNWARRRRPRSPTGVIPTNSCSFATIPPYTKTIT